MKNISIIIGLAFLFSCASIKPPSTSTSECTNCPLERVEFWNRWLAVCAPGNDASSTSADRPRTFFRTVGVKYEGFKAKDSLDYVAMVDLYPSEKQAQEYLPNVIRSGSDYPNKAVVTKGEYLTKIVKIGNDISGYSVYYITPEELERLKMKPSRIEQELGLPLTSNAGVYLVYRMYALNDNVVFQSNVAPTVQYSSPSKAVYWTSGGAMQTLVLNNSNTTLWAKDSIALDTLKIQTLPDINQTTSLKE
ncbi:MAG: hypothetical protein ACI8ZO_001638 [Flavobacteriales bacterium]|jgi:hypothetical protein